VRHSVIESCRSGRRSGAGDDSLNSVSLIEVQKNVPLAPYTTLGVGGPALWFCEASTEPEVAEAVAFAHEKKVPLFVLGGGSNLLVSDSGFAGLVLRVSVPGRTVTQGESSTVDLEAGAGEDWDAVVRLAVEHDFAGMECLAGIPGDVGGTPVQNVGAYGQEVADTIVRVRAFDLEQAEWVDLTREQCGFAYRRSIFNSTHRGRYIVTAVTYRLRHRGAPSLRYADVQRHFAAQLSAGQQPSLVEVYEAVRQIRAGKGMLAGQGGPNGQSAGSFFKNPVVPETHVESIASAVSMPPADVPRWPVGEGFVKLPAAWLIERAGFARGYTMGPAGISTLHTLALVNRGGARAVDLLALRDTVIAGVASRFGVRLEQEPVLLGF
jgi:UDP-N-acetylmuramate dehydrogenase